jgi:hypothetical protein
MPRTCFKRANIFAARCGKGGKTFEFRFTQRTYQIAFANSRSVLVVGRFEAGGARTVPVRSVWQRRNLENRRLLSLSNALRTETVRAPVKPTRYLCF